MAFDPASGIVDSESKILGMYQTVARMAFEHGDYHAALRHLRVLEQHVDGRDVVSDSRKASIYHLLGKVYLALGQLGEAEHYFKKSLDLNQSSAEQASFALSDMRHLADCYRHQKRFSECHQEYDRCAAVAIQLDSKFDRAKIEMGQAQVSIDEQRPADAKRYIDKALALLEEIGQSKGYWYGRCLMVRARLLYALNQLEEAGEVLQQALSMVEPLVGPDHPIRIRGLKGMAKLRESTGHAEASQTLSQEAEAMEKYLAFHDR